MQHPSLYYISQKLFSTQMLTFTYFELEPSLSILKKIIIDYLHLIPITASVSVPLSQILHNLLHSL